MENIVFDLGGVLFARDRSKCTQEFHDFFSFIRSEPMPAFWEDYDRGVLTLDEVTGILSGVNACPRAKCEEYLRLSIDMQEPVKPTEQLVRDLKAAGYKLYVLSNMSREFIDFLRRFPVYGLFDGEVVSCEEGVVKPEPEIYRRLLGRYGLDPAQTLFIDDRPANIAAAAALGIRGQLFDHSAPQAVARNSRVAARDHIRVLRPYSRTRRPFAPPARIVGFPFCSGFPCPLIRSVR